jgi:hypothetical protein
MTFLKVSGPAWLSVTADGTLSGTPGESDAGLNSFSVRVDATGGSDTATLNITVVEAPVYTTAVVVDLDQASFGDEGPDRLPDVETIGDEITYNFSATNSLFTEPGANAVPIYGGYRAVGSGTVASTSYMKLNSDGKIETRALKDGVDGLNTVHALLLWDSNDFLASGHDAFGDTIESQIAIDVKLVNARGMNAIIRDGDMYYLSKGLITATGTLVVNGLDATWAAFDPEDFTLYDPSDTTTFGLTTNAFESRIFTNVTGVGLIANSNRGSTNPGIIEINDMIVSLQRNVGGSNNAPVFAADPIVKSNGMEGFSYSASISADASDPDSDPLTFSKISGPAWLVVAANGDLSGTPGAGDVGGNSWTVEVDDGVDGTDQATLNITVDPAGSDFNGDGKVNLIDLAVMSADWQDGYDMTDLLQLAEDWLIDQ